MSARRVIAAEVITAKPTPTAHDYTRVRNTMLTEAASAGYQDITRLLHTDTEAWPKQGAYKHRFEAVAQHAHKR